MLNIVLAVTTYVLACIVVYSIVRGAIRGRDNTVSGLAVLGLCAVAGVLIVSLLTTVYTP